MARYRRSDDSAAADRLVARLERLHGLPRKFGQMLALGRLSEDESPFAPLCEGDAVLAPDEVRSRLESSLGVPLEQAFARFDERGTAASLSQVHRAETHDGASVAVKLRLPGVCDRMQTDLQALGWLTAPFGGLRRDFDLPAYRREVGGMLSRETDFEQERVSLDRFAELAAGQDWLVTPEAISPWCRPDVLTMTWVDGWPFAAVRHWDEPTRQAIGERLIELFLTSVFDWGVIHADPHPGNYRFVPGDEPVIGLIDFGCVKALSPRHVESLRALLAGCRRGSLSGRGVLETLVSGGFDPDLLAPLRDRLPAVIEQMFAPFCAAEPFDPRHWSFRERIEEILGEDRWNLRFAGPADWIYLIRAYQGLIGYLRGLDTPLCPDAGLEERWLAAGTQLGGSRADQDAPGARMAVDPASSARARRLRVRCSQDGATRVALTMRAEAAARLWEVVPPDVIQRLEQRRVDVAALGRRAEAGGFPPGELFTLEDGTRSVRVWLE